jgi:putative FmdB family regulatory protein
MPTYPYRCNTCSMDFEERRSILAFASPAQCHRCGSSDTRRLYRGININLGHARTKQNFVQDDAASLLAQNTKPDSPDHDDSWSRSSVIRVENSTGVTMNQISGEGMWDGIQVINSDVSASNLRFRRLKGNAIYGRNSSIKVRDADVNY